MKSNDKSVLLVGGGSGGHAAPILEIYKILKKHSDLKLTVVGGGGEIEKNFFGEIAEYYQISAGKMHRVITWRNIVEFFKLMKGFFQALSLLLKLRPKIIFAKGGYVSLPITFWARMLGIDYFIHESDIEMGFSNRLAEKKKKKIFTGFPVKFFSGFQWSGKVDFVGQLVAMPNNIKNFDFGFKNDRPTILVTGGSQGSKIINDTIFNSLDKMLLKYNIIHQTGVLSWDDAVVAKNALNDNMKNSYFIKDFLGALDQTNIMYSAINNADLVITRCGLNTLAEIAFLAKPMIMIPYQHSSSDHQNKNAKEIGEITGFPILYDRELNYSSLDAVISQILSRKETAETIAEKYEKMFPQNGLKIVSENILKEVL